MTVALEDGIVRLRGACHVEEAETLLRHLLEDPSRTVDLTGAGHLHAAVLRVLLALRPPVIGPAADPFVTTWLLPLLQSHLRSSNDGINNL